MKQTHRISLCDPNLGEAEKRAICAVIDSCWLSMGDRVKDFEKAFAELHKSKDAVAVNSCTAALHLCLLALGIGPGDEVLVPSLTFVATVNAVRYAGATPVFLDIESLELPHIDLEDAEKKRTDMTRAIIIMHYAGYVAEIAQWRAFADSHGLYLVEDAAHAPATGLVGRWSDASAFSFFSNKNMTTAEGGMVLARDPEVLERVRHLRSHGMTTGTLDRDRGHAFSYDVTALGYNYRMDELRAAMGIAQLGSLPRWNECRRELSDIYRRSLARHIPGITFPFSADHETAAHLMPILLPKGLDRQRVMEALRRAGIQSSIHYPPVHQFTYYRKYFPAISLPNTEEFFARELSLPLHPGLSEEQVTRVVKTLRQAISHSS